MSVLGLTWLFILQNRAFQQRLRLGVSPDCKMCVRVTYTGEIIQIVEKNCQFCAVLWHE